jgi:peptidoglycan/LPS O-acetylase OafA/YrhL
MPKTLKTFTSFQAARAIAALLVVFYHCFVIFDQPFGFERRFL